MLSSEIAALTATQREYFKSGATRPLAARRAALNKLYEAIRSSEAEIAAALKADLGKSHFEGFMCEIGLVLGEITHM